MNFRWKKRIGLIGGKGPAVNLSKSGASLSIPLGPLTINISRTGISFTLSPIKGSGVSLHEKIKL